MNKIDFNDDDGKKLYDFIVNYMYIHICYDLARGVGKYLRNYNILNND